jgi:2-phosphosulfolactate phosphatase
LAFGPDLSLASVEKNHKLPIIEKAWIGRLTDSLGTSPASHDWHRNTMKLYRATLDTCHEAGGLVVVIDVLRAFTTAATAFARGVEEILLVSTIEEAFELRTRYPECLLIGEVEGFPVNGFDLPNSPSVLADLDLATKHLIQRTSAGTQGVVRAVRAERLLAASLCVASATCAYIKRLNPPSVTFVETGVREKGSGDEDIACADYMACLLDGSPPAIDEIERRVRTSRAAQKFVGGDHSTFPRADLEQALNVDCFDFAMEARRRENQMVLTVVQHSQRSQVPV